MIKIAVVCFTEKGLKLAERIKGSAGNNQYEFELYGKFDGLEEYSKIEVPISAWTLDKQKNKYGLVFISAMGIAVRAIASGLESKLSDAPVVVVDELGVNVIPVVGGHVGGANELALHIAEAIGAKPIITTATDLEGCFSVDLLAKESNLSIYNKDGIAKVSSKALAGKPVRISIKNYPPKESEADVIISGDKAIRDMIPGSADILLCPKRYAVGIGCKKGTLFEDLKDYFDKVIQKNGISKDEIGAIASIDLKEDEEGIIELCRYYRLPFITFTSELLSKAKGEYEESDFVKEKTGVGNVCERAAMLLTGNKGKIIQKKTSENGMTIAIASIGT